MSLAQLLLRNVEKLSGDLDLERIRGDVRRFEDAHPDLTAKERAREMIWQTSRKAAALGAVASLPPGLLAFATMPAELTTLIVMQSRLVVGLHLLYGNEPEPEERAVEVLAGLAAGAGLRIGRELTVRAAEKLAARILLRLAGRGAARVVPVLGAVVGGLVSFLAVEAVGRSVLARIERRQGPPGLPGHGPVVDVA